MAFLTKSRYLLVGVSVMLLILTNINPKSTMLKVG